MNAQDKNNISSKKPSDLKQDNLKNVQKNPQAQDIDAQVGTGKAKGSTTTDTSTFNKPRR
jgi:hypothetical protein